MMVSSVPYGIEYLRKVSYTQKNYFRYADNASAIEGVDAKVAADRIMGQVIPLGQRFYPSESAFPLRKLSPGRPMHAPLTFHIVEHIASLLVRFALAHKGELPYGWAPRILTQCGVPYPEVWDILHEMYESQVRAPIEYDCDVELLC